MITPREARAVEPPLPSGRAWKIAAAVIVAVVALNGLIAIIALHPAHSKSRPAGLVSRWRVEGIANDLVGGASGTLYGGVTFAPGRVGQCFAFDGVNGAINVPDVPALALTNSLTIEGWLFLTNAPSMPGMVLFRGNSCPWLAPYYVSVEPHARTSGLLNFCVCNQANMAAGINAPMPIGAWTQVAATLDDATGLMTLYTNGVVAAQTNTTVRPFGPLDPRYSPGIGIGNHSGQPGPFNYPFRGRIDELSIYCRALSASEIQAVYSAGKRGERPPAGLVSWWRPEGHALDQVGGNHGVLMSGVGFDAGVVGQAFRFDGSSNSYVEVADSPTLRFTNALTLECWAKRLNTSQVHTLVEKGGAWTAGQTDYEMTLNDTYPGGKHFGFASAGAWRACAVTPDTAWHHYAAVAVSGWANPILYIDGVRQKIIYGGGGYIPGQRTPNVFIGRGGVYRQVQTLTNILAHIWEPIQEIAIRFLGRRGPAMKLASSATRSISGRCSIHEPAGTITARH